MVQKYQSPVRVYKYPFELVMKAYERRFPSCPQIPVVVNCEVISDDVSPCETVKKTERRCKLKVDAPYILKKIIGVDHVYFLQTNVLNLRTRTLEIEAKNESFQSRVIVLETCRYFVHPENSEWTCFEQVAEVDIHSFFGFENTIEKLAMKQYAANIAKGKEIIEHFMAQLREEGIIHVPIWVGEEEEPNNSVENGDGDENDDASQGLVLKSIMNTRSNSITPIGDQLETEYIQRYVGRLEPMQESRLVQLRQSIASLQKGKMPSDTTMLRFLRARDFNVDKARHMLSESLTWRKTHGVDKILSEYTPPKVVQEYFPGGWHHHDKEGRPLYLLRLGQMDVKGLLKSIGTDGLLKLTMHICEEGLRLTEQATLNTGKPITTWSLLIDLDGLNMRHLWRPGVKALLKIIEIVEANYPETLGRVLIIRAPRVFPILWTIVSAFIDDMTRSKFLLYGGNDYQEPGGLVDYIPQEFLPHYLGGQSKTKVEECGLVPKNLYLTQSELEHLGHMEEDSLYQSISISKGHSHEVNLHIEDVGSVITWDFDVMKQDAHFTIIHSQEEKVSVGGDEISGEVVETVWCRDGESVQGSHVCSSSGLYVMRWTYPSSPQHNNTNPAKIIYFYQLLPSADYKGSMSSLQSGTSSFSALSAPYR